jgi:hypothetical protein
MDTKIRTFNGSVRASPGLKEGNLAKAQIRMVEMLRIMQRPISPTLETEFKKPQCYCGLIDIETNSGCLSPDAAVTSGAVEMVEFLLQNVASVRHE